MDSAQTKRMILAQSELSGIRKKLVSGEAGISNDDIIEAGMEIEKLVNMKGWSYIDYRLTELCDPTKIAYGTKEKLDEWLGGMKAAMGIQHYIDQTIKAKNELLRKANERAVDKTPTSD